MLGIPAYWDDLQGQRAMRLADKIKGTANRQSQSCRAVLRLPVWLRITSLAMALALTGSVVFGMPLHSGERDCGMFMSTELCQSAPNAYGSTSTPLCCLLSPLEQGPTEIAFNLQTPAQVDLVPQQIMPADSIARPTSVSRSHWPLTSSFSRIPTYIKNLALLI